MTHDQIERLIDAIYAVAAAIETIERKI